MPLPRRRVRLLVYFQMVFLLSPATVDWLIGMFVGFVGTVVDLLSGRLPEGLSFYIGLWSLLALPAVSAAWSLLFRRAQGRPMESQRQRIILTLCVLSGLAYCVTGLIAMGLFDPRQWSHLLGRSRESTLWMLSVIGLPVPVGAHLIWHLWWGDLRTLRDPSHVEPLTGSNAGP